MEYKVYSNEEVASWSDAPRCLTKDVLKQHIDENGYFNRFKAIISLDYIDNAMTPILEQQLRTLKFLKHTMNTMNGLSSLLSRRI